MNEFDYLLPVPLHPKRLYTRGYNQCDCIVEGLEHTLETPALLHNLVRVKYNESQTRMARYERWKNVETIFQVNQPELLQGKKVLLIDDVITTGSTIEACANILCAIPGLRLSVAALATPR
jgi:ComF family protein